MRENPPSLPDPGGSDEPGGCIESGSGQRVIVAVNPVDPRIGGTPVVGPPVVPRSAPPHPGRVHTDGSAVEDVANGAVAILAVAAALVRYAAEMATRSRRSALPRLPFIGPRGPVLRRALSGPVARVLAPRASAAVRTLSVVADELVPGVTRAVLARLDVLALVREFVDLDRLAAMLDVDAVVARVDLDAVLDRVDVDAIAARLDLDAAAARLDLDAVAARLDLNALVDEVDVARVIDRVDLDAIAARLDLDAIAARLDLDAVAARLDLNALVDEVDLDRAVSRVDLDRAVDRVDVDRVIARTDVAGLARYVVQEIDLPGLLSASTGTVTSEMVRSVRDQGADADRAVERVVDRLLHRHGRRTGTTEDGSGTDRPGDGR